MTPRPVPAGQMVELATASRPPGGAGPRLVELRAEVRWDTTTNRDGRRFFHALHQGGPPTISELIEAEDLHAISGGRQRMTGTAIVDEGPIVLEVWSTVDAVAEEWSLRTVALPADVDDIVTRADR